MSVHRNTRYKDKTKSPNRQEIRRLFPFEATVSTCLDTFSLGSFKVGNEVYEATSAISFEMNLISQKKSQNTGQAFILKVILLIIRLLLHEGWPFEPSCCLHKAFILCHKLSPRHLTFITMPFTIKSKPLLM